MALAYESLCDLKRRDFICVQPLVWNFGSNGDLFWDDSVAFGDTVLISVVLIVTVFCSAANPL